MLQSALSDPSNASLPTSLWGVDLLRPLDDTPSSLPLYQILFVFFRGERTIQKTFDLLIRHLKYRVDHHLPLRPVVDGSDKSDGFVCDGFGRPMIVFDIGEADQKVVFENENKFVNSRMLELDEAMSNLDWEVRLDEGGGRRNGAKVRVMSNISPSLRFAPHRRLLLTDCELCHLRPELRVKVGKTWNEGQPVHQVRLPHQEELLP